MLGKNPFLPAVNNRTTSNPIKMLKRDAQAVRIKLAVGGLPEKILIAFQSVFEAYPNEEMAFNKYNALVQQLSKIVEDVENGLAQVMGPAMRLSFFFSVKSSFRLIKI